MNRVLNRIALFISLVGGGIIAVLFTDNDFFLSIFLGGAIGILIKKIYLSEKFIEEGLHMFIKRIKDIDNTGALIEQEEVKVSTYMTEDIKEKTIKIKDETEVPQIVIQQENIPIIQEKIGEDSSINNTSEQGREGILEDVRNKVKENKQVLLVEEKLQKIIKMTKVFFSTNTLAKIGGVLISLGLIYFLRGAAVYVWGYFGPVGRLLFGFAISGTSLVSGFIIYKKEGLKNEGIILIGLGILLNYVVILSGRYLIGVEGESGFLTEGITFIFLILNTSFSVLISLMYNSRTLLVFSLLFAYVIPFIIGAKAGTEPYTLVGYSIILSFGGLFLSQNKKDYTLLFLSFIFGNVLLLLAPFSSAWGLGTKLIAESILSIATLFIAYNFYKNDEGKKSEKYIIAIFTGIYICIILQLIASKSLVGEYVGFSIYMITLASFLIISVKILEKLSNNNSLLKIFLLVPIVVIGGILITGNLIFPTFVIFLTMLLYIGIFALVRKILGVIFTYSLFGGLIILLLCFNIIFSFDILGVQTISEQIQQGNGTFILSIVTVFIFMFASYFFSTKKHLSGLFSLGTIGTVITLSPLIVSENVLIENSKVIPNVLQFTISICAIGVFAISNWAIPFINNKLLQDKSNIGNVIAGSLIGVIFIAFQIYNFGEKHFSGVAEGIAFLILAIIYFSQSFLIVKKLEKSVEGTNDEQEIEESLKNIFYTYAGISISLFSFAITFLFSNYPEVISIVWLFEASILFYFAKIKSEKGKEGNQDSEKVGVKKIIIAGNILFAIGIAKLINLINIIEIGDYKFLVSAVMVGATLILNIKSIDKIKYTIGKNIHYILHILGIGTIGIMLVKIIESSGHGWSQLGMSLFIMLIGFFYNSLESRALKYVFILMLGVFSILHLGEVNSIFWRLEEEKQYLKIIQYIVSLLIIGNHYIWRRKIKQDDPRRIIISRIIMGIISVYAFGISNIYILDIFEFLLGDFTLSMYWGILGGTLLLYGINTNKIQYRTVGLYLFGMTFVKILGADLWYEGESILKFMVCMSLGMLSIITSILYTKKIGDNMMSEFHWKNLRKNNRTPSREEEGFVEKGIKQKIKQEEKQKIKQEEKQKIKQEEFMKELEKVNVVNIKVIRFFPNQSENFTIRAENLLKMVKVIVRQTGKNKFEPGEVLGIYNYIVKNYRSSLSRREYDKIRTNVKQFIDEGGKVEIIEK